LPLLPPELAATVTVVLAVAGPPLPLQVTE
jgi:hypothetical protein